MKGKLRSLEAGCDTTVWLACQPNNKLQAGELYFDRQVVPKHFRGMGTEYDWKVVEELVQKLDSRVLPAEEHL